MLEIFEKSIDFIKVSESSSFEKWVILDILRYKIPLRPALKCFGSFTWSILNKICLLHSVGLSGVFYFVNPW